MEFRNRYIALYVSSVVISVLAGFIFQSPGISLLLLLVLRLAVNIWYAQKLHLSIFIQLFTGIFSTIGLLYLLGFHPTLSPVTVLLQKLIGFYEKNFKKIFLSTLALMGITIVAVFAISLILVVIKTFGFNQATTNLALFILNIAISLIYAIILLVAFLWFYGALMYILDALITNEPAPTLKAAMRMSWSKLPNLVGAAGIKGLYIIGPFAVLLVIFLIQASSSLLSVSTGRIGAGFFNTYSAFNSIYYLIAALLYIYTLYIAMRLTFSNYGVLFTGTSIIDSIRQSFWLTKGMWWPLAWRIFASSFIMGSVMLVTVGSFAFLTSFGGIFAFLGYAGQIGLYLFFFPLLFCIPLYLYYELRNFKLGK